MLAYKCFNKGLINRYGKKFEVGKKYIAEGIIKYGNNGNGFHSALRLEDTLIYFDSFNNEIDICLVEITGQIIEGTREIDDGYYDLYSSSEMTILKVLTREEIINYALNLNIEETRKFVLGYKLTTEEIELFENKFKKEPRVLAALEYYQKNNKFIYDNYYETYYSKDKYKNITLTHKQK